MTETSPKRAPPVEIGQMLSGKYLVERVLGEGGMGMVVAATHVDLDQRVAIKCLLPEAAANKTAVDRFAREARACAKLRGDNVVHVTDVGTLDSGTPYMVMEYLEGEDLGQHLQTHGRLAVEDAVDFVLQACAGLAEAHAAGIVHRDLKPANLFLAHRADVGRVLKVVDFGISKVLSGTAAANLTTTRDLMGSPLYMSPEQLKSLHDVDARTDIWAMGIILYELLAGAPPFQGDTLPQVCSAVMVNHPTPVLERRADLPAGLSEVVARCLEKEPDDRYANVAALALALSPYAPERSAPTLARITRLSQPRVEAVTVSFKRKVDVNAETAFDENSGALALPQKRSSSGAWLILLSLAIGVAAVLFVVRRPPAPLPAPPVAPSSPAPLPMSASAPPSASSSAVVKKVAPKKSAQPAPSSSGAPSESAQAADDDPYADPPAPSASEP